MSIVSGSRLGPYDVGPQIGVGGMGEVYRATDTNLKRAVALKVLPASVAADAERLARFQREAEVLASLNHPNIAAIYGLERSESITALVMELVDGPTLADRIANGAMSVAEARPIGIQIAQALEAAHGQGIVHRDLKPANIKVRPDGTVKVLDFGLAKAMDPASSGRAAQAVTTTPSMMPTITSPALVTSAGMILGTAAYMSPEQARGLPVDKRADVWALGAVLYEMLTGARAFAGDTVSDVVASVLAREPDWTRLPPSLPPALRVFIQRCLHKEPKQRVNDAGDVRLALEGVFDIPHDGPAMTPVRPLWAVVLPWAVAAAALLAAVSLGVAYVAKTGPTPGVIRTMIPPPDGATFDFDLTAAPAVLSPDGRKVAFGARSADGLTRLWVRPLESAEARPIEGTVGASFPFWSPDSRTLGFYSSRGRLERIGLDGGSPVAIAIANFVRGAHWGLDGTIVFDDDGGISAVAAAGGAVRRLTTSGVYKGETARSPWLLPDNRHFLYTVRSANQIRVASLDGSEDALVTEATSSAMLVKDRLLFMREDTLLSQPFDLSRRVVTGAPVAVASGVQMIVGEPRGVFSASETGALLYQDGGTDATSLAWFDREGKGRRVIAEMGSARGVFLSPDDRFAIVQISDTDQSRDLWRIDTADGRRSRLTFQAEAGAVSQFTAWSPDGRFLANGARRGGRTVLTRRPASGSGAEEVIADISEDLAAENLLRVSDWSRDGALLVYSGDDSATGLRTLALGRSGPSQTRTIVANGQNGRLSPNGKWVSCQGSLGNASVADVYIEAFPSGGQRVQVASNATLGVWSADGLSMYYASDNVLYAVDVSETEGTLRLGTPHAVMPIIQGRGFSYDIAQDGRILALVTSDRRASRPLTLVQNWMAALGDD